MMRELIDTLRREKSSDAKFAIYERYLNPPDDNAPLDDSAPSARKDPPPHLSMLLHVLSRIEKGRYPEVMDTTTLKDALRNASHNQDVADQEHHALLFRNAIAKGQQKLRRIGEDHEARLAGQLSILQEFMTKLSSINEENRLILLLWLDGFSLHDMSLVLKDPATGDPRTEHELGNDRGTILTALDTEFHCGRDWPPRNRGQPEPLTRALLAGLTWKVPVATLCRHFGISLTDAVERLRMLRQDLHEKEAESLDSYLKALLDGDDFRKMPD